jgi:phosphatidate cytidylyltransferase
MAQSELTKRVAVAAVGVPLVVVVLYLGRWAMGPVLALFCAGAALEFYRLAERQGIHAFRVPGAVAAAALVLIAAVHPSVAAASSLLWTWTVFFILLMAVAAIWERGPAGQPLLAIAVTLVGAVIPGAAMGYAIFLRHLPVALPGPIDPVRTTLVGVALVAYALAVTWVTDSAAFFGGKRWGKKRLIPSVSPGKTVAGAVAGLGGGLIAGWVVAHFVLGAWLGVPIHPVAGALGGLLISALSQLGDLVASVWKREAGVKDSGTFFPGHGGIIDRMDSLLFTIPGSYWLLAFLLGRGPGW